MRLKRPPHAKQRTLIDARARHQGLTLILFMVALVAVVAATLAAI